MKKMRIFDEKSEIGEFSSDSMLSIAKPTNSNIFEFKDNKIVLKEAFWAQKVIERKFLINKKGAILPPENHKTYKEQVDKNVIKVLLILESPHKDEFGNGFKPIAPAQGYTGNKINDYIKFLFYRIENNGKSIPENFELKYDYLVTIYNPVPYQASLGSFIAGKINNKIKKIVWAHAWENKECEKGFECYMNGNNFDIIINACTYGFKKRIGKVVVKSFYSVYHPVVWSKDYFKKINLKNAHK